MWKIAFRNLLSKKTRTLLALTGLMIAVVGVVGLISISDGIKAMVNESLGSLQGVQVLQKDSLSPMLSRVDMKIIKEIENFPEVDIVTPRVFGIASSIDGKAFLSGGMSMGGGIGEIIGIDPVKEGTSGKTGFDTSQITQGRFLKSSDTYSAVLGKKIADGYKKSVGSVVELNGIRFKVVGIWTTGSSSTDNMILIPIDIARKMFSIESDKASMLTVYTKDPGAVESISKKIELRIDNVDAKSGSEYAQDVSSVFGSLDMFFWAISLIAVVVGGVGILNTMLMSVMERFRDFGILKAIGWSNGNIMTLVVSESIILGVVGGLAGLAVGYTLVEIAKPILGFPMQVTPTLAVTAVLLAASLGLIGGLYPARKASRLNPIEAIRYG
jgi:putative ABC transport system permease protein